MNETAPPVTSLPVVGAALPISALLEHREWLLEHGGRDLEIQDAYRSEVIDGDYKPLLEQARNALEGHAGRVGIHGPYDGLYIASWDPPVREFVASRYLKALDFLEALCETLGSSAPHMVIHSPFLFFGHAQVAHTPATGLDKQMGWAQQTLEKVLHRAQGLGCTLVLENIFDRNPQPLKALVESFDSPFVRISLDAGHANLMRESGAPPAEQWALEAAALLGHVHLQDNDGFYDRHWPPGQGSTRWWALMQAIAALKTEHPTLNPRLLLEVRSDEIKSAANWMAAQGLVRR